ncbi:MAG: T9SS type A sorting domain-containing protein [Bacteroidales bacterium]|nr:T9SS type A sorting domain-containing protein [Bacteroidales bacterium]
MKKVFLGLLLAVFGASTFAQFNAGHEIKHIEKTVCMPYHWDLTDTTYTSDTTVMKLAGDTIFILDLTFSTSVTIDSNIAANCVYVWRDSLVWKTAGLHTATVSDPSGCDSIYRFNLTLKGIDSTKVITKACDKYRSAWGEVFTADTTIDTSYTTAEGCQRNDTLHLKVYPSYRMPMVTVDTTCNYRWRNKVRDSSNVYYDTVKTRVGRCDSIFQLRLTLTNHIIVNIDTVVCDRYVSPWRQAYTSTAPLTHNDTVRKCITTTNVNLTVNHSYTDTAAARTNARDITAGCFVVWGDSTLTDTTRAIHLATLKSIDRCDSIAAIRIVAYTHNDYDTNRVAACGDANYRYRWHGERYNAGQYDTTAYVDSIKCTHHYHLELTISEEKDTLAKPVRNCASVSFSPEYGRVSTQIAGPTYLFTPADTARATTFAHRIDGNAHTYDITTRVAPNGDTIFDINPISKCKRYYTVQLTVKDPQSLYRAKDDTIAACDRYTFVMNYSRKFNFTHSTDTIIRIPSGQRSFAICQDSIAHLVLTLNQSSYEDTTVVACDSYHWPFNDTTYTRSIVVARVKKDTAGHNILNDVDCPINGRLNLTINKTPTATISGNWLLNPGETTELRANCATEGVTYAWYRSDISTVDTTETITITAPTNGDNIDVHLVTTSPVAPSYCATHNWITIASTNLGIGEVEAASVSIYPNPTSRIVNLKSDEIISRVIIYNTIGQRIIDLASDSQQLQLDLTDLASGHYTMSLTTASGAQISRKLVVSK